MSPGASLEKIASDLLGTQNLSLQFCEVLQTLWAGYGHIARITACPSTSKSINSSNSSQTYILKHVSPPVPRKPKLKIQSPTANSGSIDEGHIRKLLSYQIEQSFYVHLGPLMPEDIAIASCLAHLPSNQDTTGNDISTTLLLTDLRINFPVAGEDVHALTLTQVRSALKWLASFHGFWWGRLQNGDKGLIWQDCVLPPLEHVSKYGSSSLECYEDHSNKGLVWQRGGYSHLVTRRKEYQSLESDRRSEWSQRLCSPVDGGTGLSVAELVDMLLYPSAQERSSSGPYQTLIHGDVKSENLFTSSDGSQVAFYDFQYVGLGLGVCDLAKLFTVSIPLELLLDDKDDVYRASKNGLGMARAEEELLRKYCKRLEDRAERLYEWSLFTRHWETALVDWLRFQASWGFWGNTEWLEGRVRKILQDEGWLKWLTMAVNNRETYIR